jgi:hypothetical protein
MNINFRLDAELYQLVVFFPEHNRIHDEVFAEVGGDIAVEAARPEMAEHMTISFRSYYRVSGL